MNSCWKHSFGVILSGLFPCERKVHSHLCLHPYSSLYPLMTVRTTADKTCNDWVISPAKHVIIGSHIQWHDFCLLCLTFVHLCQMVAHLPTGNWPMSLYWNVDILTSCDLLSRNLSDNNVESIIYQYILVLLVLCPFYCSCLYCDRILVCPSLPQITSSKRVIHSSFPSPWAVMGMTTLRFLHCSSREKWQTYWSVWWVKESKWLFC